MATGQPNMREGIEKKMLKAATATPAARIPSHRGTALPGSPTGNETPDRPSPVRSPDEIGEDGETGIKKARRAQTDPRHAEIHDAIKHMGSGHQDHGWANSNQAQGRTPGDSVPRRRL